MQMKAEQILEITKQAFEWGKSQLDEGKGNLEDEHIEWLIKQAETLQKIADRWCEIEFDQKGETSDFYSDVQDLLKENGDY